MATDLAKALNLDTKKVKASLEANRLSGEHGNRGEQNHDRGGRHGR